MRSIEIDVAGIRARAEGVRVAADSAGVMAAMTKDGNGVFKVVAIAAARSAADVPALLDALAAAKAQVERLREKAQCSADHPDHEDVRCMLTVGHDGEHVPDDPDVATWPSRAFDALQQRDEARAQLADRDRVIAAVRELAENARRHAGGPYTASVDALSIERALDQEATR